MAINVHNVQQNGGKAHTLLISIALSLVVSFMPLKVLFRVRTILATIHRAVWLTKSFVAVLILLPQLTGGLVDIYKHIKR